MRSIASILIVTSLAACAHDVEALYPRTTPAAGTLEVALNAPTSQLTVAVNGDLVVDRKHSRRARIAGVPAGRNAVRIVTSGACEVGQTVERLVDIAPGAVTTLTLPAPDDSLACAVFNGLYYVGMNVGIVAVAIALAATGGGRAHK